MSDGRFWGGVLVGLALFYGYTQWQAKQQKGG